MSQDQHTKLKPGEDGIKTGIDNSKNPNCSNVYKDKFGNKWYAMRNPLHISGHRGVSAEKAKRFMTMKIDETSLMKLLDEQIAQFNLGEYAKSASIAYEIKHRLKFICEEKSILDLVFIYYFLEDEDPEIPNEYFRDKKHAILEQDPTSRAFFLRIGISLTKKFFAIQEENMIPYLEKMKEEAERIYRFISRQSPIDLTSK